MIVSLRNLVQNLFAFVDKYSLEHLFIVKYFYLQVVVQLYCGAISKRTILWGREFFGTMVRFLTIYTNRVLFLFLLDSTLIASMKKQHSRYIIDSQDYNEDCSFISSKEDFCKLKLYNFSRSSMNKYRLNFSRSSDCKIWWSSFTCQ